MSTEEDYAVIKFTNGEAYKVISTGHTREEAKEICNDDDTSGDGWFYGFGKSEDY